MEIKWGNLFGFLFIVFAIYLFFKAKPAIDHFFDNLEHMPLHQDPGTLALMFLGTIVIGIIAAVAIISNRKQ